VAAAPLSPTDGGSFRVNELNHPLVDHHLGILRSIATPPDLFRQQIHRLAMLLAVEACRDLQLEQYSVTTPLQKMEAQRLVSRVSLIPILRAGLGLVEPILQLIPEAEVWHLGMYRDEETAQPVEYYCKLPESNASDVAFVLDPMLATGGSVRAAVSALRRWGVQDVRVLGVLATPDAIRNLNQEFPDVQVWVAKIDPILNNDNYIVPGLGDAGDRIFNTDRG
jgi:uracil phosphoribosyltransferase